jgi:hypothetical protein
MDEQFDEQQVFDTQAIEAEQEPLEAANLAGDDMTFKSGFAAGIAANRDARVSGASALGIAAGRDMELSEGGAFSIAVGHDLKLTYGGAFIMPVGNSTEIHNGGAILTMGNQVSARNSFFGVLLAQQTTLEEGSKVLLDTKQAIAFGAALGAVLAVLSWLLRRK